MFTVSEMGPLVSLFGKGNTNRTSWSVDKEDIPRFSLNDAKAEAVLALTVDKDGEPHIKQKRPGQGPALRAIAAMARSPLASGPEKEIGTESGKGDITNVGTRSLGSDLNRSSQVGK
jgi:hypothetical protein